MTDTFAPTLPPQEEPTAEITLRTKQTRFGDGYRQIIGDGLNAKEQRWPLSWKGTFTEVDPIRDFFDAHIGVSFFWTPPNGVVGRYICGGYSESPAAGVNMTLTATLEQVFTP